MTESAAYLRAVERFVKALHDFDSLASAECLRELVDSSNEVRALHDAVLLRSLARARRGKR